MDKIKKLKKKIESNILKLSNGINKEEYDALKNKYRESKKYNNEIMDYLYKKNPNLNSREYIEKSNRSFDRIKSDPKLIAFYLPQFHTIPENDKWWGSGFTEWTNVTLGQPQFLDHYQPHLPDELGFYDLTNKNVFNKQIKLAKKYGVYGFCFYYYWFSGGKRLLEEPIFNFLSDKTLKFPFMLCWANESWSRNWEGFNEDILIDQDFKEEDIMKFIKDIIPFFKDDRYIKVDNSPILIVYRPKLIKKELMLKAISLWRDYVKSEGFNDLYLIHTRTGGFKENSEEWNFDAAAEFPPNNIKRVFKKDLKFINPNFKGKVYDFQKTILKMNKYNENSKDYKTVLPSWDNTARRKDSGRIYQNSSPDFYRKWLYNSIKITEKIHPENKLLFINAWNEWAEGAHLEPDRKYGFAYLEATLDALLDYRSNLPFYDLEK